MLNPKTSRMILSRKYIRLFIFLITMVHRDLSELHCYYLQIWICSVQFLFHEGLIQVMALLTQHLAVMIIVHIIYFCFFSITLAVNLCIQYFSLFLPNTLCNVISNLTQSQICSCFGFRNLLTPVGVTRQSAVFTLKVFHAEDLPQSKSLQQINISI